MFKKLFTKKRNPLRSFSFRAGLMIFLTLCVTLLGIRIFIFYSVIREEESDVRDVIRAHLQEIDEQYKKYGGDYVANSVAAFAQEARDNNLVLVFKKNDDFYGNYTHFPNLPLKNGEWFNFTIKKFLKLRQVEVERSFLAKIVVYNKDESIIVAYDTQKIEKEKKKLPSILLQYIAIAIIVSLWISWTIVWLLNRNLQRFNQAYSSIKKGDLKYRIKGTNSNDQFDMLIQNFNSMMEWINTLLNTIKDTTNNLAHDLRTPISRHRLNLEALLNKHELSEEAEAELENSISEVDRVIKIFNNILSISKAEDKSGIENFKIFSLNDTIADLADFFEPIIEERKQSLELSLPEDTEVSYFGEPQLFTQAVYNIIDNALKYNRDNGKISISLNINTDNNIEISVTDEGGGIPEDMLEKVKDKFFRLDTSRTSEGIGLGLSLIDSVIKLHNGTLVLSNTDNEYKGLKVLIILQPNI